MAKKKTMTTTTTMMMVGLRDVENKESKEDVEE
jgi:hypothetical protein